MRVTNSTTNTIRTIKPTNAKANDYGLNWIIIGIAAFLVVLVAVICFITKKNTSENGATEAEGGVEEGFKGAAVATMAISILIPGAFIGIYIANK